MTALKTGNVWLWPCVALLIVIGALRALRYAQIPEAHVDLTADEARTLGDRATRSARCSMPLRSGSGALSRCCGSDDAVAHMICMSVTIGYMAAGAGRTYGRPWIFHVQIAARLRPDVARAGAARQLPITSAWRC